MTEHRNLKALVRARMARTGESYTTAHRHVTAARGGADDVAAVPGTVGGYPATGPVEHRDSALAARLLQQAGLDVDETLACGLGGGIGFMYAVFDYKAVAHPLLTVVAQHHPQPWVEAVTGHLALPVATVHSSAVRPALARLDAALDDGRAALLAVSRAHLPWHVDVDPVESAEAHRVVVAGRLDGDYLVDDPAAGAAHPLRTLAAADLGEAWRAHRKGRFELLTVAGPDDPSAAPLDVTAACRRAMTTTADHLTGPVLGLAFDVNFGFSGMARLVQQLRDDRTAAGWARRYPDPDGCAYATARLAACLTDTYTGVGGTRPLYARFLTRVAKDQHEAALAVAAAEVEASGRLWLQVAERATAASRASSGTDAAGRASGYAEIADLVEAAAEHEAVAVERLREVLGGG